MAKRMKFDLNSPEADALREEITHGTFLTQGSMVAFPLCFPGASAPIAADESFVTALDIGADNLVYGGTSGHQAHLIAGMFHGVTGAVMDLGTVEGMDRCVAVCCGEKGFVAFLNGPGGSRAVRHGLYPLPGDLLQEWGFDRKEIEDLGPVFEGERVHHAVASLCRKFAVAATDRHLVRADLAEGKVEAVGEIEGRGRLAVGLSGGIFGLDKGHLWRYDLGKNALERNAVALPDDKWEAGSLEWARNPVDGTLYASSGSGRIYPFIEGQGFGEPVGQVPQLPVRAMAVTLDGRLFGYNGEGISKLFCYNPAKGELELLGVALSVFERRRYGYQFASAAVGRDGQIFFGENDDLGHLWIYFPNIQRA